MSFQIKEKRKIVLLRKCVQILTQNSPELSIHFTKTHVRFFNRFDDSTTYMVDFMASWFSKFVAPECVLKDQVEKLQVACNKDTFLQSFNILDDSELEFLVTLESRDEGLIKVMKTRDFFIVEAHVSFSVSNEIICDEVYNFPEEQLLISSKVNQLRSVKDIFKQQAKTEQLTLSFSPEVLAFKGVFNKKFGYEIRTSSLDRYGTYLSRDPDNMASNYAVKMPLTHLLGVLKVAEMIGGDFQTAMECLDPESAVCFLFSKTKDFMFNVGVASVGFENLDQADMASTVQQSTAAGGGGRLRKPQAQEDPSHNMSNAPGIEGSVSRLNLKHEGVNNQIGNSALSLGTGADAPASEVPLQRKGDLGDTEIKKSGKSSARKKIIDSEEEASEAQPLQQHKVQEEEQKSPNQDQDDVADDANEDQDDNDLDERQIERKRKRAKFYKDVDEEDFF